VTDVNRQSAFGYQVIGRDITKNMAKRHRALIQLDSIGKPENSPLLQPAGTF